MQQQGATTVITIPFEPTRQSELEEVATAHGQTPADALDQPVALYLEVRSPAENDLIAVQEALADREAGLRLSLEKFDCENRRRYDFTR